MRSLGAALLVIVIFSLFSPFFSSAYGAARGAREFDYFLLSLQWPGTFCQRTRHCCPSNGCCKSIHEIRQCEASVALDEFTIQKHGTCSSPVLQDEYSYFSTTLDLYFTYNITKVLNGAGFLASNTEKYKQADISAVIKNSTGGSPWLVCSHDTVQELRLCLHKDFTPRDCGILSSTVEDELNARDSCPQYIRLPKYTPPPGEYPRRPSRL
ncbi:unnamed protein product [Spirodela intermedia]|uniref:Uncharacterized protein n=1 Tax=Spirodela intermedia TaxID=51605 RepID=A0A7I8KFY7_SPIIN|nr:unnamed protein product [Spirodela intermedia]